MEPEAASESTSVRVGRFAVRIYHRTAERGRAERWIIADYSSGSRRLRSFADLRTARAEATRIAHLLRAGDTEGAAMTGDERRDLVRATELVAPLKLDVPTACALFAEAAQLIGPHAVVAAAREFAKRHPAARDRVLLAKAADDYFKAKEAKGRSPRLLQDIRSRIGRFVHEHPGKALGDFGTANIQRWLDHLKRENGETLSVVSRRNFAVVLGGFFEHCRRRGIIGDNPCRDLERDSIRSKQDIEFWTPEEAQRLLVHADDVARPALALALFAGVRTAEICRLTWHDVRFNDGHLDVGAGKSKTASRRLVPMSDNLRVWLLPLRKSDDAPIYPEHATNLPKRITEAAERASVRRFANGARHSFITYSVALTGDISRVALESGNSVETIHRHYRGLATREQANAWFAVFPAEPSNVVSIARQAA